jgi:YihY family inner membrane protein
MIARIRNAANRFQQRNRAMAFVYGVLKKFGEDRAGEQAALLAYYGFFSIFPLLLFAVTVLAMVLRDNPALQEQILSSALAQFPIIGDQIKENVKGLADSGVALAIGMTGALWAGLAGVKALQNAMDHVWNVPVKRQPGTPARIGRGLVMLAIFGAFALASTVINGVGAGSADLDAAIRMATFAGSLALNVALYLLVYKTLTVAEVSWNDIAPGAALAGTAWTIVQSIGTYYVGSKLKDASALYGLFGLVIGLLSWLYLGAQITLLGAEVNVVRTIHAWPRSIDDERLTQADRRSLARQAIEEERVPAEEVSVDFRRGRPSVPTPK